MASSTLPNETRPQINGVLPISASQTAGNAPKSASAKLPTPKLKLIIRRLPPGLTETEFITILGDEWRVEKGRVQWFAYKPGKDSKDPSKPSRPSRAYLHLTSADYVTSLSDAVRQTIFEDSQSTFTNTCLIGPPTVEFAPYGRTPGTRRRFDARAGTIDQDTEFMAFLEGLANPTPSREVTADFSADSTSGKLEKVTTTPLVQYLKDLKEKRTKNREGHLKASKKAESKGKLKDSSKDSTSPEETKKKGKADKLVEKAAKEAVKILNRDATSKAPKATDEVPTMTSAQTNATNATKNPGLASSRQRGQGIAAAKRLLQRDLGLATGQRQARTESTNADKAAGAEKDVSPPKEASAGKPLQVPTIAKPPKQTVQHVQPGNTRSRGKGSSVDSDNSKGSTVSKDTAPSSAGPSSPIVLLKKSETQQPASPSSQPAKPTTAPTPRKAPIEAPTEGATRAFVKHANPSQGVTEPLLKEVMETFGAVSAVEIDKKKGFAYVDFVEPEGLKKAIAANPIAVAQGTVQVMPRKAERPPGPNTGSGKKAPFTPRGSRGSSRGGAGGRGGRGGSKGGAAAGPSSEGSKAPASAPTGPAMK